MQLPIVTLKKGEGRVLKTGGLWIYDNEIASVTEDVENGGLVAVADFDGYPMGIGFYNAQSKITIRILTRDKNKAIDDDFLRERVERAWAYRKKTVETSSCRIILVKRISSPAWWWINFPMFWWYSPWHWALTD